MKQESQYKKYKIWGIILIVFAVLCMIGFFVGFTIHNKNFGTNSNSVYGIGFLFGAVCIPIISVIIAAYLLHTYELKKYDNNQEKKHEK